MRQRKAWFACAAVLFMLPLAYAGQTVTVTETFDGTVDEATWHLGTLDQIDVVGGNPGSFLHNPQTDRAVPEPIFTGPADSPFLGDYRARGVVSLGIDVNIFSASRGLDHRNIALILASDMGTPDDPYDDCEVYTVSHFLPKPGSGWKSFEIRVPSQQTRLPAQWVVRGTCNGLGPDDAWNAVLSHVTRVTFPFSDPDLMWYFQQWDLGIDNARITFRADAD